MAAKRSAQAEPPEAPERAHGNMERDLVSAMRRYRRAEAAQEAAAEERDRVIRDAIEAKLPYARIAELTGLSRPRLDQIRRGERL